MVAALGLAAAWPWLGHLRLRRLLLADGLGTHPSVTAAALLRGCPTCCPPCLEPCRCSWRCPTPSYSPGCCSICSQPHNSPTKLELDIVRSLPHRDAVLPRTHGRIGTPKGSTRALTMQPLPLPVRLSPRAIMPCRVLVGSPPPGPLPTTWWWQCAALLSPS